MIASLFPMNKGIEMKGKVNDNVFLSDTFNKFLILYLIFLQYQPRKVKQWWAAKADLTPITSWSQFCCLNSFCFLYFSSIVLYFFPVILLSVVHKFQGITSSCKSQCFYEKRSLVPAQRFMIPYIFFTCY